MDEGRGSWNLGVFPGWRAWFMDGARDFWVEGCLVDGGRD